MLRTALGPAIAGFLDDPMTVEVMLNPDGRLWIDRLSEGLSDTGETLPPAVSMGETMMLGLRLIDEGVTFARFRQRHRVDMRDVYDDTLAQLRQEGLLTVDADGVRLTRHGLMLGNQVFMRFLAEPAAA